VNEIKQRERTFTWSDPREVAANIIGRPHEEWMADLAAGRIPQPPFASAMGYRAEGFEPGCVRFSVAAEEWSSNPVGVVHGGFTSALLDTVMTLAVVTRLPMDRTATTVDLHVHLVRPVLPDGRSMHAEGVAVNVGSTLGTAEGRIFDANGKLVAHGTGTFAIITPQGSRIRTADS
jgi:uncharacterized protein (TIGR00369 family)